MPLSERDMRHDFAANLAPHPDFERLSRALERCLPFVAAWSGVLFRSTGLEFATPHDLLTGEGSRRAGGRWNPQGLAAVYGSLEPLTAMAETLAYHRSHSLPLEEALPRVFVAVRLSLQRVLDLTDGAVRHALGVSRERMVEEPWREQQDQGQEALTQAIGRAAWQAQVEALLVPSAQTMAANLVLFPDRRLLESRVEIVNPEQLPERRRRRKK